MIGTIIRGIFGLIMKLFDLLLSPILLVIYALFPSLENYFTYVSNFLNMGFTYLRTCMNLVFLNNTMITALFDYFLIMYSIHLTMLAIRFIITIYNKFKI